VGVRGGIEGAAPIGIERLTELDAAVHAQQIVDGDRVARILGIAPGRNPRWCLDCELFLPYQDADQRIGDRFGHRPADLRRLGAIARRLAFGDDVAVVQDHRRLGPAMRAALGLGELAVECGFEGGVDGIDGQRLGGVLRRRRRIIVYRGPCGALVRDPAALGAKEHRPAGDQAGEVGRHLPLVAVDAVIPFAQIDSMVDQVSATPMSAPAPRRSLICCNTGNCGTAIRSSLGAASYPTAMISGAGRRRCCTR